MGADLEAEKYKEASTIQKLGRDPVIAGCCHEPPREGQSSSGHSLDWIILGKMCFTCRDVGD